MRGELEITKIGRKVVYSNKWMTVYEDQVKLSNGSNGIYGVVDKKDFALVVPVQDSSVYLVQQYRYPVQARFWELPQGSVEQANFSAIEIAKRELKEETGLSASSMEFIGFVHEAYGYATQGFSIFVARELQEGNQELEPEESGLICKRFSIQRFKQMIADNEITDAATIAALGLLMAKQVPEFV